MTTVRVPAPEGEPGRPALSAVPAEPRVLEGLIVQPDEWTPNRILRSFFDAAGDLVPLRRAELSDDVTGHQLVQLQAADEITANALSANTRRAYGAHARQWLEWALEHRVALLPAAAEDVKRHLTGYVLAADESGQLLRDGEGRLVSRVVTGTVEQRLAAIDALHRHAELSPPGADDVVREFMRGLRNTFGTRPHRAKAAADMPRLRKMLAVVDGGSLADLRRQAVIHLALRCRATPGQLARLAWLDVQFSESMVRIELPCDRVGAPRRVVIIRAHRRQGLCTLELLRRLHKLTGPSGPVLATTRGTALTRQAIHKAVVQLRKSMDGWPTTPGQVDAALTRMTRTAPAPSRLRRVRDTAVLTVGWFAALRRDSLIGLNWDDLTPQGPDGWSLLLTHSKNDQEGAGKVLWLPRAQKGSATPDPAAAIEAWHEAVTSALGYDPRQVRGIPVFAPINRHGSIARRGNIPQRMSGSAVNELVQDLATRAGLNADAHLGSTGMPIGTDVRPFGAHSLRAGFITEALTDDKLTIAEVMDVSTHRSADVMLRYFRAANGRKRNATRKLLGLLD